MLMELSGKTVRLDVYDPRGDIFQPHNASYTRGSPFSEDWSDPYPILSDIHVKPNDKGQFFYRFPVGQPVFGSIIKGIYKIEAIYDDKATNATFKVQ